MVSLDNLLTSIVTTGDAITSDGLLNGVKSNSEISYFKRDFLFRNGIWRGNATNSSFSIKRNQRNVALIGHSDFHTNEIHQLFLRQLGFKYIYGSNLNPIKDFSETIPLGLTNHTNESDAHRIFGNQEHFKIALTEIPVRDIEFRHQIYVNMSIENSKKARTEAFNKIRNLPNLVFEMPTMSQEGRINYLKNLRKCAFVLCPRGNGLDTVRTWETLYMGGIPVVKKHRGITALLNELPVVLVDSWSQASDPKFMYEQWTKIHKTIWNVDKLKLSYWLNQIGEKARSLK